MPEETDKLDIIKEELEELISLLVQEEDSRSTNLQLYMEELNKEVERRENRRWVQFLAGVTAVFVGAGYYTLELWERQYDRINSLDKCRVMTEHQLKEIDEVLVSKHEFKERLLELHRERDKERREALENLEREIKTEINKLHPRYDDGHLDSGKR